MQLRSTVFEQYENQSSFKAMAEDVAVKMVPVFVYGTLQKGEANYRAIIARGHHIHLGRAKLLNKKQKLVTASNSFPCLVDTDTEQTTSVVGDVFLVDIVLLASLDRLEGTPDHYIREKQNIKRVDDDVEHEAFVYKASPETVTLMGQLGNITDVASNDWLFHLDCQALLQQDWLFEEESNYLN